MENSC